VAIDRKGNVKLEYLHNGEKRIRLWEKKDADKVLETTFDSEGSILVQVPIKQDGAAIDYRVRQTVKEAGASKVVKTEFTGVRFNKPCPKCGEFGLARYVEAFASNEDIPVMPIYYCKGCKSQSYYLTDAYLNYLIENNSSLFEQQELAELSKDRAAFTNEIREYIIRIFASKKVLCIK
jgi:hypothetical protein